MAHSRAASWVIPWFVVLMVVTIGVRVADPTGWLGSDDASYHNAAEHVLAGKTITRVHHQFARMSVVLPIAMSILLFGDSPTSVVLPAFAASIGCIVLVVIIGRLVWGWWEGLLAGSIVAVLPYFRVLSTAAYPDVHACFWSTAAVVMVLLSMRAQRSRVSVACAAACGLALGLAASAKIFAVLTAAGVGGLILLHSAEHRRRLLAVGGVLLGGLAYILIDGLYHWCVADDFWFKLHALQSTQSNESVFAAGQTESFAALAWNRLTMLFRPAASGWGLLAVLFWPAALIVFMLNREGRGLVIWAVALYLAVALMPVSFQNGLRPFPIFHGRHVLVACVPLALCLAWVVQCTAAKWLRATWARSGWPIALAAIVVLSSMDPHALNGFRDRPTSRMGEAVRQVIAGTDWAADRKIFMPASLYLRFRILFPPELRDRLRVAVDDDAPDWWRRAATDIEERCETLPAPGDAYLLATPLQLGGKAEFWDYGVTLPAPKLAAWNGEPVICRVGRDADKRVRVMGAAAEDLPVLLVLMGNDGVLTERIARVPS